jgi:hypothetical protein
MNLSDELRKLQQLRDEGVLNADEFAQAKAAVLARESAETKLQTADHRLSELQFQTELARLDREWQMERERYMVSGRYGSKHVPSEGSSALMGIAVVGFGIFWTIMAASMGAPMFFPLFGVFFIGMGFFQSVNSYTKAGQYKQALKVYEERRAELIAQRATSA